MSSPSKSPEVYSDGINFYDADFTADINKKMRVPDKIKLQGNSMMNGSNVLQDPAIIAAKKVNDNSEWMRVPERICVVGGESHITTRETPPELKLEHSFLGKPNEYEQIVQLATPPSTLRIEDTSPVFDTPLKQLDKALKSVDGSRTATKSADNRMNDSLWDYEDPELSSQNYVHLRRRLLQITQRIDSLEIENSRRNKREFLLYTIGVLYILFRGVNFFAGRNQF